MCQECLQQPCHPRCPNAPEPKVFTTCEICGSKIYEGDEFYQVSDIDVCEKCIYKCRKYAED